MTEVKVNSDDVISDLLLSVRVSDDGKEHYNLSITTGVIRMNLTLTSLNLLNLLRYEETSLRCRFEPVLIDSKIITQKGIIVLDADTLAMPTIGSDGTRLEWNDRKSNSNRKKRR